MNARKALVVALVLPAAVGFALSASIGQAGYTLVTTVSIPTKEPTAFDISFVDPVTHTYYLADRTNKAIDIVDTESNAFVQFLAKGQFVGNTGNPDTSGPNGILPLGARLWVGDGGSKVKVVDLATGAVVDTISTGGTKRADELCFDPRDDLISIANDADSPPFVTLISTETHKVVGQFFFPDATDGLEQCQWDPDTGRILQNVPSTTGNPGGEVVAINPKTMTIVKVYPVEGCFPAGMALGPHHRLLLGCSGDALAAGFNARTLVMDAQTGHVVATITQVGGSDEVWFNPGDNRFYLAARNMTSDGTPTGKPTPVLGVIDAETNTWVVNISTGTNAHSVAADSSSNTIFVPIPGKGIDVFQSPVGVPPK